MSWLFVPPKLSPLSRLAALPIVLVLVLHLVLALVLALYLTLTPRLASPISTRSSILFLCAPVPCCPLFKPSFTSTRRFHSPSAFTPPALLRVGNLS